MIAESLVSVFDAPDRLRAIGRERMVAQYGSVRVALRDLCVAHEIACTHADDPCAHVYHFRDASWVMIDHDERVVAYGDVSAAQPTPECECARDTREARRARSRWQYLGDGRAW